MSNIDQKIVDEVTAELLSFKDAAQDGVLNLSIANINQVAVHLMAVVQRYKSLTGPQKKGLVIHVLRDAIKNRLDASTTPVVKNELSFFVNMALPPLIDTMIQVDKGEISIKNTVSKVGDATNTTLKLFSCCTKD